MFKYADCFRADEAAKYGPDRFSEDLKSWFESVPDSTNWNGCAFVPFMEAHFNPMRGCTGVPSYPFAASVYVMIVASQIILRDYAREIAAQKCRQKGWPVCSAGMGGFLHPIRMVYEADLLPRPGSADVVAYLEAMESVKGDLLDGLPRYIRGQTEEGIKTMRCFLSSEESSVDRPEWSRPSIMTTVETEEA